VRRGGLGQVTLTGTGEKGECGAWGTYLSGEVLEEAVLADAMLEA